MSQFAKRLTALVAAASLALSSLPPLPALAQDQFESCKVDNEEQFRERVTEITSGALRKGLRTVDYEALVDDQWRKNDMDALIDRLVDAAAKQVREESSWSELISSIASKDEAKKLAEEVAERAYRSDAFKSAVQDLSTDVGQEVAKSIELATLDAAVPAVRCVRAFLGGRYGATIARIVSEDTRVAFEPSTSDLTATIGTGQVVLAGSQAIAGTVILLVRRTLTRMASRVGQRVVGAVLARVVSVIAGGVGVVLIAKDLWDLRHGVLPIITSEMKSETAKANIRAELASAISDQMNAHVDEIAAKTADRIVDVWRAFREAHTKVVELSEKHEPFKSFLGTVGRKGMPRVDRVVSIILAKEGEAGVRTRLRDGTLDEAVKRLPEAALTIAGDTGSIDEALAWQSLAGETLDQVLSFEIHRAAKPDDYTEADLARVIALDDRLAISRMTALDKDARHVLTELDTDRLRNVARALSPGELADLGGYLGALGKDSRERVLQAVSSNPQKMKSLAGARVRGAILNSRDQEAALAMMLRTGSSFNLLTLNDDFARVVDGQIAPILLWEKHPYAIVTIAVLALIVLMILRRLLFGSRRRRAA